MAKNTNCNVFRTLDVDRFSEDNYKDDNEVIDTASPGANESLKQIEMLLSTNKPIEALNLLLCGSSLGIKDSTVRDASMELAVRVLMAIKTSQIDGAVAQLDNERTDILMKFIYRGFESPSEGSSAHLLQWHDRIFSQAGPGSIVRVLTDKKTV